MTNQLPELLLPAGNLSKLRMALAYGADAVYVGAAGLSMRPDQSSFGVAELAEAVGYAQAMGKKCYVAANSLIFQNDLPQVEAWLDATRGIPMDAVILSDVGAIALTRRMRPELELHISTQLSTANVEAARFWGHYGATRVVLARECSLADAEAVVRGSDVEVEVFVHGAMCMAVSGRCLLSAHLCGQSGSTGACKQSCRWEWQLVESKRPGESFPVFETGRETIFLGSTDLCLIEHIPELVRTGVRSLKVEGRMKSEYYVASVARVYRAALDRFAADPDGYEMDPGWLRELEAVSHRPYAKGFAFGYPAADPGVLQTHNRPVSTGEILALPEHREGAFHILSVKNAFALGDAVAWIAPGDACGTAEVLTLLDESGQPLDRARCGSRVQARFSTPLPEHAILRRHNT
ncbi:MAG: U32 family peptidase C-terminal domain-containing protein [Kiritimatiellae bacterium]|nr:U32 family peptidase C-terminal domain-containing protein [Kiritimatiellia bacterium]